MRRDVTSRLQEKAKRGGQAGKRGGEKERRDSSKWQQAGKESIICMALSSSVRRRREYKETARRKWQRGAEGYSKSKDGGGTRQTKESDSDEAVLVV